MSDRSLAPSILIGAATVLLSGAAAYLGASMARPAAAPQQPVTAPAGSDAAVLESMERRLHYIEQRMDTVDQNARTALDIAKDLQDRMNSVPGSGPPPVKAPTAPNAAPKTTAEPAPEPPGELTYEQTVAKATDMYRKTARTKVMHAMNLYADKSDDGPANRLAQAVVDTRVLLNRVGAKIDDEGEGKIRKVLQDEWETGARDIGPIVRNGLEKADITTVKNRLKTLHAETDKRLRELLDEPTWKAFEDGAAGDRAVMESVLDEYEKK